MPTVRVLLSQMPQILRDIFEHEILHHPDLELVEEATHGLQVSGCWGRPPDVVVMGTGASDHSSVARVLLAQWPRAQIMFVTPTEGEAALCELRMHTTAIGCVSPAELVQTIRRSAAERAMHAE